jgi:alginate O-acetyltransferase complex protein AlgI
MPHSSRKLFPAPRTAAGSGTSDFNDNAAGPDTRFTQTRHIDATRMLFNSYPFLFLFLPVVLAGYFQIAKASHRGAAAWLTLASLVFYGYWNVAYVALLLASIACNYGFGAWIARTRGRQDAPARARLIVAIAANLALLAYYKYANFFLGNLAELTGLRLTLESIILPLGISFFTFTQIAFLVDTYQGKVREYDFVHYALFVTYFPHLIAGPVLHHKEMMPQFAHTQTYRFSHENMAVGSAILVIGLFKKVVLADGIAVYVSPVFNAPAAGIALGFFEAWAGALCYGLQLYFDFSGYSDMAIGLSRMFGVVLPLNFHSPYKAVNIIEFWRRWHMTLSRFLRDYLYFPLGGNRKGTARRYLNLLLTMVLGGLWHGAGWTFVLWGALHGAFLVINHGWQALRRALGQDPAQPLSRWAHAFSVLLTFLAVTVAWVFFRADTAGHAWTIVRAMAGANGYAVPGALMTQWGAFGAWLATLGVAIGEGPALITRGTVNWLIILLGMVWFAPNTQQILGAYRPALDAPAAAPRRWLAWTPNGRWLCVHLVLAVWAIAAISQLSEFLYFQF